MVNRINAYVFLDLVFASEGSDIYEVRKILEQKVLDSFDQSQKKEPHGWGPSEYATHIVCSFMTKLYNKPLVEDKNFSISQSLNDTLRLMAYENWRKRQRFGIIGDEKRDWEHGLHSFAQACLNYYAGSMRENEAA